MNEITGECVPCRQETTVPLSGITIVVGLNGDAEFTVTCAACGVGRAQQWTGVDTPLKIAMAQKGGATVQCVASVRSTIGDALNQIVYGRGGRPVNSDDSLWHEIDLWERTANPPAASA